jgi:hypothetical protein
VEVWQSSLSGPIELDLIAIESAFGPRSAPAGTFRGSVSRINRPASDPVFVATRKSKALKEPSNPTHQPVEGFLNTGQNPDYPHEHWLISW